MEEHGVGEIDRMGQAMMERATASGEQAFMSNGAQLEPSIGAQSGL